MRLLIRRYVTAEQRKRDDFGITEDDVMEIRQDISTLRYELIDILRINGMQTPNVDKTEAACKLAHKFSSSLTFFPNIEKFNLGNILIDSIFPSESFGLKFIPK